MEKKKDIQLQKEEINFYKKINSVLNVNNKVNYYLHVYLD